jgi:hypothetical protein
MLVSFGSKVTFKRCTYKKFSPQRYELCGLNPNYFLFFFDLHVI